MKRTLVIVTFDESEGNSKPERIYTVLVTAAHNHYSVLRTIEDNFGLDPIHKESGDGTASVITGIWKEFMWLAQNRHFTNYCSRPANSPPHSHSGSGTLALTCIGCRTGYRAGGPDPKHISTSFVEPQDLSKRLRMVEELRMHLAWRWFTGLGFDQEIPHHSTFSKNRHGRFQESKLFEQLFERIVKQCMEVGLVRGKELSVDGSFVEANAAKESRIPREQLAEAAEVHQTVRQYLREVEEQNPVEEPVHEQDQVSTTDPDSTYATKGGTPARLGYYDNYLVDNHSCVIVGVQATAARMSQETVAAQDMLTRFTQWQGREPESVAADTTYGNGEFLQWLADRSITPYMRTRDSIHRKRSPFFGPERFTYEPEPDRYICPAGQPLNYGGQSHRNHSWTYIGTRKRCGPCSLRPQCTSAAFRCLVIHQHEPARQRARGLANTPEFAKAQGQRKKVEALFAELKNQIGLRRLRLRRIKFVREQFFLAAAAQNIKRLVRCLSPPAAPQPLAT